MSGTASFRMLRSSFGLIVILLLVLTTSVGAQTPVSDSETHTRLGGISSGVDLTNTRLGNLEQGVVTVQQAQATQTALLTAVRTDLDALRGLSPAGVVDDSLSREQREFQLASSRLELVQVVVLVCLLSVSVFSAVRSWF